MARGYRTGIIKKGNGEDSNELKLFFGGAVDGVTWTFNRKLPDSDSKESHYIDDKLNISTSGYYAEGQWSSPQIDLTDYSKLYINMTQSTGAERKIGVGISNSLKNYASQVTNPGAGLTTIDISNLTGFYYVNLYTQSGNRSSGIIKVSHVWLQK